MRLSPGLPYENLRNSRFLPCTLTLHLVSASNDSSISSPLARQLVGLVDLTGPPGTHKIQVKGTAKNTAAAVSFQRCTMVEEVAPDAGGVRHASCVMRRGGGSAWRWGNPRLLAEVASDYLFIGTLLSCSGFGLSLGWQHPHADIAQPEVAAVKRSPLRQQEAEIPPRLCGGRGGADLVQS